VIVTKQPEKFNLNQDRFSLIYDGTKRFTFHFNNRTNYRIAESMSFGKPSAFGVGFNAIAYGIDVTYDTINIAPR